MFRIGFTRVRVRVRVRVCSPASMIANPIIASAAAARAYWPRWRCAASPGRPATSCAGARAHHSAAGTACVNAGTLPKALYWKQGLGFRV